MKDWIIKAIEEYVLNSPENTLKNIDNEPAWGKPLIGFASGDDPLWEKIKEDVGSFLMTPFEIFSVTYPLKENVRPRDLTVIAWVLPQTEKTKSEHRKANKYPTVKMGKIKKVWRRVQRKTETTYC